MSKQALRYLIYVHLLIIIHSIEFSPLDYELYGPTLAANDQFIIAIQSRTDISFSAVSNYSAASPKYCSVTYTPPNGLPFYATMIAVGRNGLSSTNTNKFVFTAYSQNDTSTYLIVASVDFTTCQLVGNNTARMFSGPYSRYSVLGVDSNGQIAFYLSSGSIYMQNLISPYFSNFSSIQISFSTWFIPAGIDLKNSTGVLGVYIPSNSGTGGSLKFRPAAYRIDFSRCFIWKNALCFNLTQVWQIAYSYNWQSSKAPPNDTIYNEYDSLYDISVSINDQDYVLLGIQSVNTVFCFSAASTLFTYFGSRLPNSLASIGFGRSVGWLDNTTAVVLRNNFTVDYALWRSSNIDVYPITNASSLSNSIAAYASYPNSHQQLWRQLNDRLIDMLAIPGSGVLIYMDYAGLVHIIRPSLAKYYASTSEGDGQGNNTIYTAPTYQCPSGTLKNQSAYGKDIFRYCLLCPEGTFYSANLSNQTGQCTACDTSLYFCPWGAVAQLPVSVLDTITQAQVYPQSPENEGFEDILLLNMFNVDFSASCLTKQPLFYAIIIIGIGCLFLLFMGILKLTGKLKKQRRMMKSILKQTDLIGEGELWIGGVVSFAIVVISVFAYRFSSAFMYQYPIETVGDAAFACDPALRNAKFSTSMQSLGTPLLDDEQPLFDLLNNQPFTLNIAFISTDFTDADLTVSQALGSILLPLPHMTNQTDGVLQVSTNLTSHSTTIKFTVQSNSAVGALRVGLTGPSMEANNYRIKQLNFSHAFNRTNRTVTQNPIITIQLIKLINQTEPLSNNDNKQFSALWIPAYIKNDDQLFYTESDYQLYHVGDQMVLTVNVIEATYYIYNKQEPITKLTEIIFTNILFTTMCIELFGLTFLFFKLAILPIIRAIIGYCTGSNKVVPKNKQGGGVGCPYCRSVDPETLPAHQVPIQRAQNDAPAYPIRRQTPDIGKLYIA